MRNGIETLTPAKAALAHLEAARARILSGLVAFTLFSAAPARALADGSEIVTGIAPATPAALATPAAPEMPPPPPPSSALPTMSASDLRMAALVAGGIAVAGAAAGAVFGVLALDDKSRFDDVVSGTLRIGTVQGDQAANSANENAVLADVCLGGAVVAAVTSIVLFVKSRQAAPEATVGPPSSPTPAAKDGAFSFTVAPLFTSHGGGAGAALIF